tara:strand:+ start:242 stop:403 length:162 start_codon:yes stop_codon:yes gene_type:complete
LALVVKVGFGQAPHMLLTVIILFSRQSHPQLGVRVARMDPVVLEAAEEEAVRL